LADRGHVHLLAGCGKDPVAPVNGEQTGTFTDFFDAMR
jgi:hypothetical protein